MGEVLGFLGSLAAIAVFLIIVTGLIRDERPRRGSYVVPQPKGSRPVEPPVLSAPAAPLFHSRYCCSRHGAPCDCKGPHS